jgi:signal transduction histidine kinase
MSQSTMNFFDRVLLIHTDAVAQGSLENVVAMAGFEVLVADSVDDGLDLLARRPLAVVCGASLASELLPALRGRVSNLPVVVLGEEAGLTALEAWRAGAFDYVADLSDRDDLVQAVSRASAGYSQQLVQRRTAREAESERMRVTYRQQLEIEKVRAESALWAEQLHDRNQHLREEISKGEMLKEALRVAHDEALAASRAKSTFLANMSHELRTPLNAILGYTEMLIEDLTDQPPVVADLERVRGAGSHLLQVINGILDLSRIEAGRVDLSSEHADLAELAESAGAVLRPLAAKKGLAFEVSTHESWAVVDPTRTRQILLNVLGNAVKFTDAGSVRLDMETRDDHHLIRVTDSGPGMSEEDCGRVFRAFERATTSKEGTGLGLAISEKLCELMGGWIRVESELGVGTTFEIGFPEA